MMTNPSLKVASLSLLLVMTACDRRPSDEQANAYGYCAGGASSGSSELGRQHKDSSKLDKVVSELVKNENLLPYMQSGADKHYWRGLSSAQRDYLVAKTRNDLEPFLVQLSQECDRIGVKLDLSGFDFKSTEGG